ncbi:hypothetical protein VTI74DRAFT_524 [Chaetomium olivicolor]
MPRQHTFTIVPNPLGMQGLMSRAAAGAGVESKPPMTSKQAKKLYQQATRVPRLSKSEQRRLEREEQERIRREFEKEKQANKARILREKKKAKEQAAIEAKKKRGLPLVAPRPSQDTIARFVRGDGLGDSAGAKVELPAVAEEVDDQPGSENGKKDKDNKHPADDSIETRDRKRKRLDQDGAQEGGGKIPGGEMDILAKAAHPVESTSTAAAKETVNALPTELKPAITVGVGGGQGREHIKPVDRRSYVVNHQVPICSHSPTSSRNTPHVKPAQDVAPVKSQRNTGDMDKENIKPSEKANAVCSRSSNTVVRPTPAQALDEAPGKEPHATALLIQQCQRSTPAQSIPVGDKATTPQPNARKVLESAVAAVNEQVYTPQQDPPPKPLPAPTPTARQLLQEPTNSLNHARPCPAARSASKFASSCRPGQTASRPAQAVPAIPVFKQAKPETPTARVQRPQFLSPHLRHATTTPQPPRPTPTTQKLAKKSHNDWMTAPPTSTQLFIMRHIDEFPTLSQEELEEARSMGATKVQKVDALRPPVAGFAQPALQSRQPTTRAAHAKTPMAPPSATRQLTRQAGHVRTSMAPPPRPAPGRPIIPKAVEPPDFPFFSTQDLYISSQDLRDLDEPTPTRNKPGDTTKPAPFKKNPPVVQQHRSPPSCSAATVNNETTKPHPSVRQMPAKPPLVKQPSAPVRQVAPTRTAPPPPQARRTCQHATKEENVPMKHPFSQKETPTPPPEEGNTPRATVIPVEPAPRPASPEKPRFFGSSGSGVDLLLALDRSRKTHEEEERKRRAELAMQRDEANTKRVEQERQVEANQPSKQPEIPTTSRPSGGEHHPSPPHNQFPQPENNSMLLSQQKEAGSKSITYVTASQETDYGDLDIDIDEIDIFGL